jgi:colanic acid biosynthesis glycosyl transferase WcaI
MRILVHDYAGHPFQVQLSRALARRGHEVLHAYCASLQTTPQATLTRQPGDPASLRIEGIRLSEALDKRNLFKRWKQERTYGRLAARLLRDFLPEVVISANTPLDAQKMLLGASSDAGARFVFWVQDLIGLATERLLRSRVPVAGHIAGAYYARLERRLLAASDALVLITEDFETALPEGVPPDGVHVIPNWAPLEEVPQHPRKNAWATEHLTREGVRFIYAGTLGLKHNPALLVALSQRLGNRGQVVVISEGQGADWLRERQSEAPRLKLMPFQPFDRLPEVLAAADVLVAVLEPDAGVFSVPSKVLTNLCAGRPLLLAVPPENLAARIVARQQAGFVVAPDDVEGFLGAAERLIGSPELRARMGASARRYAEGHFDIDIITDRFEDVLDRASFRGNQA